MEKLNREILDRLHELMNGYLEVTDIDVKRLRDDRSEIQLGDEVAFVATASFRLTHNGVEQLKQFPSGPPGGPAIEKLAVGDVLLVIGPDAELRSDVLPIDVDSVTGWVAERYKFRFTLNGSERAPFRPVGYVRVAADPGHPPGTDPAKPPPRELALPWIRKLNTAAAKGDYIDVDVRIDEKPPESSSRRDASRAIWFSAMPGNDNAVGVLAHLEIDTPAHRVKDLIGKRFRLPTESENGELRFALTFTGPVTSAPISAQTTSPAATTKSTSHKP